MKLKLREVTDFIDALRIFPRVFITVYIYMFYEVVHWFMALPDPNIAQSGLVSVVVGAGAAWFGLYVHSGGDKGKAPPPTYHQPIYQPPQQTFTSSYNDTPYTRPPTVPPAYPPSDNRG